MSSIIGSKEFTRAAMRADIFLDNLERLSEILPLIVDYNQRQEEIRAKEINNQKTENN